METVVNNPPQRSEGNGMGLIVGAIILLAALIQGCKTNYY